MKKTLLIAAIALIITAGTVSLVDAQMRNKDNMNRPELTEEKKAEMDAQREEIQNIMENGTYEEWKTIVESRPKMTDYITAENFAKFQEAHQLRQDGDFEGAQKIIEELGIEGKFGIMRQGMNKGFHRGMKGDCPLQK